MDNYASKMKNGNTFLVYSFILRMTIGFQGRKSWVLSDTDIAKVTGIKKPKAQREELIELGLIEAVYENGSSYVYTIVEFWKEPLQKMEGGLQKLDTSPLKNGCPPSKNKSATPTKIVGGSRGAIDSIIDNYIESTIDSTLTIDNSLIKKMEAKYPDKDIKKAKGSFLNYPHHLDKSWTTVEIEKRFDNWCNNEKPSPEIYLKKFRRDSTGFPIGYCSICNISAFYRENEVRGDSVCCSGKIMPKKAVQEGLENDITYE